MNIEYWIWKQNLVTSPNSDIIRLKAAGKFSKVKNKLLKKY